MINLLPTLLLMTVGATSICPSCPAENAQETFANNAMQSCAQSFDLNALQNGIIKSSNLDFKTVATFTAPEKTTHDNHDQKSENPHDKKHDKEKGDSRSKHHKNGDHAHGGHDTKDIKNDKNAHYNNGNNDELTSDNDSGNNVATDTANSNDATNNANNYTISNGTDSQVSTLDEANMSADERYSSLKQQLDTSYSRMFELSDELDTAHENASRERRAMREKRNEYEVLRKSYNHNLKEIISDWVEVSLA